jgi:hypothetical protein
MELLTIHPGSTHLLEIDAIVEIPGNGPCRSQRIGCSLDFGQTRQPIFPVEPIGNLFLVHIPSYNKLVVGRKSLIIYEPVPKSPI